MGKRTLEEDLREAVRILRLPCHAEAFDVQGIADDLEARLKIIEDRKARKRKPKESTE